MKYTYSLDQRDYLNYQLFAASLSPVVRSARRNRRIAFTAVCTTVGAIFYLNDNLFFGYYFISLGALGLLLYPAFTRWNYKRYYKKQVNAAYGDNFGKPVVLEFESDALRVQHEDEDTILKYSELGEIDELPAIFIITTKDGTSLIVPKKKLHDVESFRTSLLNLIEQYSISFKEDLKWVWR